MEEEFYIGEEDQSRLASTLVDGDVSIESDAAPANPASRNTHEVGGVLECSGVPSGPFDPSWVMEQLISEGWSEGEPEVSILDHKGERVMYQRSDLEAIAGMFTFGDLEALTESQIERGETNIERTVGNVFREHLVDIENRIGTDKLQTILFRLFWIQRDSLKFMQKMRDHCTAAEQEVNAAAEVRKQAAKDVKHSEQNGKNLMLRVAEMKDAFVSEKNELDRRMSVLVAYKEDNEAKQNEMLEQLRIKEFELAKFRKEVKSLKADLKKAKSSRNAPPPQALATSTGSRTPGLATPRSGQNSASNSTTNLQAAASSGKRVKSSGKRMTREKYLDKLFTRLSNPNPPVSTPQVPKLRLSTASSGGPSRMSPRVEEKFTRNFRVSREMREKICVIQPPIAKFLIEIGMKLQGEIMAKFQILAPKSKSEFEM
jgi:hypothetical protein